MRVCPYGHFCGFESPPEPDWKLGAEEWFGGRDGLEAAMASAPWAEDVGLGTVVVDVTNWAEDSDGLVTRKMTWWVPMAWAELEEDADLDGLVVLGQKMDGFGCMAEEGRNDQ
ncbi:hypothetical protein THAOC_33283 [Thalassiosira oceanica]|uniref:Uncharacterized protein n=1 Tax=Thalassiosira oceanica TaxID=159749 RepID=K0RMJ9_THAOC|nr:hypothetical protein THAOC_33283 [Thalassiosira oceanica]|eukprot:EJK47962.1 hypothetical protein THAOC_33283 [Thalassiosira oceanica]